MGPKGVPILRDFEAPEQADFVVLESTYGDHDHRPFRETVDEFVEIYVKCPLEVCEDRDTKGFYKKARSGMIKQFTGIDDPYEEPEYPEIVIETDKMSIERSVEGILNFLKAKKLID